jgi:hypothetical protein
VAASDDDILQKRVEQEKKKRQNERKMRPLNVDVKTGEDSTDGEK